MIITVGRVGGDCTVTVYISYPRDFQTKLTPHVEQVPAQLPILPNLYFLHYTIKCHKAIYLSQI
jgi:hypothetical protein